jgi:4-hydroxybenzoate polyprenyltransferase
LTPNSTDMAFLRLIRFQNLLLIALMQLLMRYGFLEFQAIPLALTDLHYALLVLATVCLAAGGYIINDINDIATDSENRPNRVLVSGKISEAFAYNAYFAVNVIGVGLGFYLSNYIGRPGFALLFVTVSATLYLYATSFKRTLLVGNIMVALLLALSVVIVGVFDLLPVVTADNQLTMGVYFKVLLDYALFAFVVNLLREIVKDMEDVNGDFNQGMNTLPIALGVERTGRIVFFATLLPIAAVLYYIQTYYMDNNLTFATLYALIFVAAPLIYFLVKMWSARTKKDYGQLQQVLKLVILFGVLSILVVTLNIRYA